MARNIRWFVTFKSLNGTSCRVNIYDNDWPAGVEMPLLGGADPFFFEEDDSDDLLNDVLRFRTGYIRVVENYFGQLDDIYPVSTFDRYVEFLYGGVVMFNGYIQVQDFSRTLDFTTIQDPCPSVIELPVISPMGLFAQRKLTRIAPPTTKTLGQLLDMALGNSTYEKVVLPDITGVGLWMTVNSLFVSPWNEDYHHSMTVAALNKTMAPESYEYLIDAICKAFGWICHDTPQALVFTMFDHQGAYCSFPVGHIGDVNYKQTESIGTNPVDIADYYTMADNNAVMNTLLPDTGIEVNYEGHMGNVEFSFQRTTFYGVEMVHDDDPREIVSICNLHPIEGLYENTASLYHAFDSSGFVTGIGAGTVAWNGKVGILVTGFGSGASGWELFKLRLYERHLLELSWSFDFGYMTSANGAIAALTEDSENKYAHLTVNLTENDNYVELTFSYVYDTSPLSDHFLMFIHDIKFTAVDVNGEPYAEYKYAPATSSDLLPSSIDNPPVSSSVTMPISMYRLNDRMIGSTLRTTKLTEYLYLMQKRLILNGKFRWAQSIEYAHARIWSYLSKKWRIIAQTFHPWDDEYELTMQHSSTFDVTSYSISTDFENVTSNAPASVDAGSSLFVTLSGVDGNKVQENSVVVMMGGVDITAIAYAHATKTVNIASVTGNISITAVGRPYDAEVEYLQSDGNQYINTGVKPTKYYTFDTKVTMLQSSYNCVFWGCRSSGTYSSANSQCYLNYNSTQSSAKVRLYSTATSSANNWSSGAGMTVGTMYTYTGISCVSTMNNMSQPIILFGLNIIGSIDTSSGKCRIGSWTAYDNGTKVMDLIPVRDNGVGYMYDKVSGTFYGNAGSGSFTYGEDV